MLNSIEKFIWWIIAIGDITQPHSSVFWLATWNFRRGKLLVLTWKNAVCCWRHQPKLQGKPMPLWLCYAPFAFMHLYFILSYKSFERMTLLLVSTQTLPNNIGFSLKRIHTYHSVQFRCARAAYSRLGKDRARPTQMLIASEQSGRSWPWVFMIWDANKIKIKGFRQWKRYIDWI